MAPKACRTDKHADIGGTPLCLQQHSAGLDVYWQCPATKPLVVTTALMLG
jgi:hypothetical protein